MRIILSFFLLLLYNTGKSQSINLSETEVVNRFDEIALYTPDDKYLNEVKRLYQYSKSKNYTLGLLKGLVFMERYYSTVSNYKQSLDYAKKAEVLAGNLKDYKSLCLINVYKAQILMRLGIFGDSKKALDQALDYGNKIENIIDRNIQLYHVYASLAGLSEWKKRNDLVNYYSKKGFELLEATPTTFKSKLQKAQYIRVRLFAIQNMGAMYTYIPHPQFGKAESYYFKALNMVEKNPKESESVILYAYESVSRFYFVKKDYEKCIKYGQKTLEIEKRFKEPEYRLRTYEIMRKSYDSLRNTFQQNKYLKLYSNLSDSINKAKNSTIVLKLDEERIEAKQEISNLRKYWVWSGLVALLLILIAGGYWYRRSMSLKKKYDQLIAKLKHTSTTEQTPSTFNSGQNYDYVKNTISLEKETDLIKKIKAFETSGKFLKKGISLSYLAHSFSTNPRQLSLVINKNKNKTFNDYINELRIKYITDRLYNNPVYRDYKISYLAEECGYASHQVFINAFRKETGMTPSYFIAQLSKQ
ncbi:helix-turn-helix domain-containing protein [Elizabethkingia ursingii]|uniref:helix-turn-helix domain-containing protein n=1 Tax=Elizabethkingia ursingii TaxID=1756150 RepID=UPI0020110BC2|nr:helix-turn-helix transcriptional regulator [Elizabethkingia ursingii]MCL1670890.1 helix-turn-helix transcriptional regulator [Elizabethkingia ursingii]